MKKIYISLLVISAFLMSADSTDFMAWLIYEACLLPVFLFSCYKLIQLGVFDDE